MNQGIRVVVYPVSDLAKARARFTKFLGVEPYVDSAYYVGFRIGDKEIGLDPNLHKAGMTAYYHVDDIQQTLQTLLDAGSQLLQQVKEVGGGRRMASVKDPDGNIIGLLQDS
jgi:predicted enzyme related to lactoylglutathione lyase